MAIKNAGRQSTLTSMVEILYSQLPTGVATQVIDLPPNAVVVDGGVFVDTADNGGTSVTIAIGDTDSGSLYATGFTVKTADESVQFDVTELGKKYASGGHITATRTEGGTASSAGKVRLWVTYVILDRATEVQSSFT